MARIGFISLGCAKNQVDCERMMYRVQEAGHEVTMDPAGCDVVVINTCGFIDSAKSEAIDNILQTAQLKAADMVGKILVTGCLSQRYQHEILEQLPEVDGVLGTGSYHRIVPVIEALLADDVEVEIFDSMDEPELETGRVMTTPDYFAYIKVAEGCDNRCSYCVIPSLRGKFRSRTMDDVLYEARLLAASGVKELIVVAQDTSRYGTDLPGHKRLLPELLRQMCKIDGIHWVRVHSLYPDEITSVITGLPGEGEEEFDELCQFLKEHRLERVGAFAFSPEEGTPAAEMEHVDFDTAAQRAEMVEIIQSRIMDDYNEAMVGKVLEVLVDGYDEEFEQYFGRSYADSPDIDGRVWIASDEPLSEGQFVHVQIDGAVDGDLSGFILEE